MTTSTFALPTARVLLLWSLSILSAGTVLADATLSLGPGATLPGGTAALGLNMASAGTSPAGLQWTFRYAAADITPVQVVASAATTAAGKTLTCQSGSGIITCLLVGGNSNTIAAGTVATATFQVSSTPSSSSIPIQVSDAFGTSLAADSVPTAGLPGSVTIASPVVPGGLTCSPTSFTGAGVSNCTVTLSAAAPAGASVALSSNNAGVTAPASVTVAAGTSSATFTATVAAVTTDATAQLTAILNGSTASASLSLVAPATPASVVCNPATLAAGAASACTVTLNKAAAAGGQLVTLSSDNAALSVPGSVTVAAGAASANFTASAGTPATAQNATVGATANGVGQTAAVTVQAQARVSGVSCSPTSFTSAGVSNCTVTLSAAAPAGGASVALSSNNAGVTTPASVTVAAGTSSATFTATVAAVTTDATAQLTATLNGGSQTASLTLVAPAVLSALACSPSTVNSGASSTCTVSQNKAAPTGGHVVSLGANNAALTVPASVTVPAGLTSTTFSATAGTVTASQPVTITATGSESVTTTVTVQPPAPQLSALSCTPTTITGAASATCMVSLSASAPSGGVAIALTSSSASLGVLTSATVAAGDSSVTFSASASAVTAQTIAQVKATYNGVVKSVTITLNPATVALSSLTCTPTSIQRSQSTLCTAALGGAAPVDASVRLSSSHPSLDVPHDATVRKGQSSVSFTASASSRVKPRTVTITATLGSSSVRTVVNIVSTATTLSIDVPPTQTSVEGAAVRFQVSGDDAAGSPVTLSVSKLPVGASFDSAQGEFHWEPRGVEPGTYPVSFTAASDTGQSAAATVLVEVMSGAPVLKGLIHSATRSAEPACSPGSLTTLLGVGLRGNASDEDVRVSVNGEFVPVIEASFKEIAIQCPDLAPGTPLSIRSHRGDFRSNFLDTVMGDPAPGVFTLDRTGSGQGLVLLDGVERLAMFRSPRAPSQPAVRGDRIAILATGLGPDAIEDRLQVVIGGAVAPAESMAASIPGLWRIVVTVPDDAPFGDALPLRLVLNLSGGRRLESNLVTVAIEDDQ